MSHCKCNTCQLSLAEGSAIRRDLMQPVSLQRSNNTYLSWNQYWNLEVQSFYETETSGLLINLINEILRIF